MTYELAKQLKSEKDKKWYLLNRKKVIERSRLWQKNNPDKAKQQKLRANRRLRKEILEHYGLVCKCCGETQVKFLSIDHINGGGNKHRKEVVGHSSIYQWLKTNKYPDGFQTLCHNCNMSKGFYGECPHTI